MRGREDIFLSMSEAEKMSLFRKIVNSRTAQTPVADRLGAERAHEPLVKDVNLKQIASLTGRNYGSVYNTYNGLVAALEAMTGSKSVSAKKLFNLSSSAVRAYFVMQSHPYKFLQALLTHEYENFDAFLTHEETSKATMLRHLKALRDFSRKFGVRFSYETLTIQGEEKRVRLFLTMICWLATDGAVWPFDNVARDTTGALVDGVVKLYDVGTPNMVTREIAMYYTAISQYRIQDGATIPYDESSLTLKYPTANIFEELAADFPWPELSLSEQLGESAAVYFLFNFLPFYVTTSATDLAKTMQRFKHYNLAIYTLVTDFLAKLPVSFVEQDRLPEQAMNMLKANLLANTVSTVEFGDDISQAIAYEMNDKLRQIPDNPALAKKVRQTLEHVVFARKLNEFDPYLETLIESYYRNLLHLATQFVPPVKVKVALMIEQTVLGYIDLLAFLISQPIVELLPPEQVAAADLVIESSTVPDAVARRGDVLTYKWAANSSNDWFGELYAEVRQIWDDKLSLGGNVDY
ncbi:helix-turn-helix domain-containing protein [Lacticaseibacillus daqingensis]|uniref:helix-turn-helix domain-containing protein n=1 Tax=Lacticaseibacillus daqingensis TaxID=2486014 RepID=UPI000F767B68|nr:helix-turn-helix domain-containing protein [Lacticaseibacillus daqingensis]